MLDFAMTHARSSAPDNVLLYPSYNPWAYLCLSMCKAVEIMAQFCCTRDFFLRLHLGINFTVIFWIFVTLPHPSASRTCLCSDIPYQIGIVYILLEEPEMHKALGEIFESCPVSIDGLLHRNEPWALLAALHRPRLTINSPLVVSAGTSSSPRMLLV